MPELRAAIFDMDGLLLDSEPFWQRAERAAFARVGVRLSDDDLCRTIGMRIDEVADYWYERRPWNPARGTRAEVVEAVLDRIEHLVRAEGRLLPGVPEAIALLQGRGLRLGLASSSPSRIIGAVVAALELEDVFEVVHSAELEARGKPHPGVYLSAMERLGVAAETAFALEDSVAGLRAAHAAGLRCVAVPDPRQRGAMAFDAAEIVLESLADLGAIHLAQLGSMPPPQSAGA
jgi:sugar-phosphatase